MAPGDRVVVWLPNVPEYLEVVFALFRLGALPVFALPAHRASEIRYFAEHAEATRDRHRRPARPLRPRRGGARGRPPRSTPCATWWSPRPSDRRAARRRVVTLGSLRRTPPDALPGDDADPASMAFLQLSGGTTGLPKLIPRTHDDYLYSVRASAEICGLTPDTVYLAALPGRAQLHDELARACSACVHAGGTSCSRPRPTPTRASR